MPQNKSIDYYKKELAKQRKQTAYAWGRYYDIEAQFHNAQMAIYNELNESHIPDPEGEYDMFDVGTDHLNKFVSDLYKKAKEQVQCSICLEIIDANDLEITKCGHTFHKNCMTELKKAKSEDRYVDCPICRTKLWNNEKN